VKETHLNFKDNSVTNEIGSL